MQSETSEAGFFAGLRFLRELRRAARANRRPAIPEETARQRYEPLIQTLAEQLGLEFGIEWRRRETPPLARGRRTYETTRWVADQSLTEFPDWSARLEATVTGVVDVVELSDRPGPSASWPPGMAIPPKPEFEENPWGLTEQVEAHTAAFRMVWQFRDRVGADVQLVIEDDQTTLSAIASVDQA